MTKHNEPTNTAQKWPQSLMVVRHGESAGNVARDAAMAQGLAEINIAGRDIDVPLSPRGEGQARALGEWLARQPQAMQPTAVLVSPYKRAQDTAHIALQTASLADASLPLRVDERLREKEFGILDRLTPRGVLEKYPEQAQMRQSLGKFYHRPPGGESWCDVVLRLRSVLDTLDREHAGERVLIVAHQVVVLCFRYLLEHMTEDELLAIDRHGDVANCSVTRYEYDAHAVRHGALVLREYNFCAPLNEAGAPVTTSPDVPVAAK